MYRSPIAHFLAPPEADYTPGWELAPEYGRPNADLPPVWRVKLEPGYAGAAIDRDEVFLLDRKVGAADTLRVFDLTTGDERWTFSYPEPGRLQFAGSRTTPSVVDDLIYLCSSFGQVHGVHREAHELVWRRHLIADAEGRTHRHRPALAPSNQRPGTCSGRFTPR